MNVLYQIINLGTSPIISTEGFGISDSRVAIINWGEEVNSLPCIYLYWGRSILDKRNLCGINLKEIAYDNKVLPIVENLAKFKDYIPEELGNINPFLWEPTKTSELGNWILRYFGLLDYTNKIFISYRRTDTSLFAHQLFEALVKAKYKPFLDCYNIEVGVDFQGYLETKMQMYSYMSTLLITMKALIRERKLSVLKNLA